MPTQIVIVVGVTGIGTLRYDDVGRTAWNHYHPVVSDVVPGIVPSLDQLTIGVVSVADAATVFLCSRIQNMIAPSGLGLEEVDKKNKKEINKKVRHLANSFDTNIMGIGAARSPIYDFGFKDIPSR